MFRVESFGFGLYQPVTLITSNMPLRLDMLDESIKSIALISIKRENSRKRNSKLISHINKKVLH